MVDNKPPDDKTTELFQQLHTPELIKELLGIEPFRTVRPTDPSILQLEMLEFDMYELYHFPNFLEFDDPDLLLHHQILGSRNAQQLRRAHH